MRTPITLENSSEIIENVHDPMACANHDHCCIHRMSNHSMRNFPQHFRDDAGFMERICPHGIGHPDPDDIFAPAIHGCDGCCSK